MKTNETLKPARLILVGGFLGAGKTSLLWEAAQRLTAVGNRVGLITNDQAPELVDTAFLKRGGGRVAEVSGSCFCCNFPGLLNAMAELRDAANADVLIAEPVGSCTDLSATIIQPLKDQLRGELILSPLSVLADAWRLADILEGGNGGLHPSAAYILIKQLEEADIIIISKADILGTADVERLEVKIQAAFPEADIFVLSTKTGVGLAQWIRAVMTRNDAGRRIAEVDYDIYAEGEAVLGWLNAIVELSGEPTEWRGFASDLLDACGRRFDAAGAAVGHVKLLLNSGAEFVAGNLTGSADTVKIRGHVFISPQSRLIFNARVEMPPEILDKEFRDILAATCGNRLQAKPLAWRCLRPGRPQPTHRYPHPANGSPITLN
jgi:Ni2+-binding GTPase involved in maturation of urease and hydrogenase